MKNNEQDIKAGDLVRGWDRDDIYIVLYEAVVLSQKAIWMKNISQNVSSQKVWEYKKFLVKL